MAAFFYYYAQNKLTRFFFHHPSFLSIDMKKTVLCLVSFFLLMQYNGISQTHSLEAVVKAFKQRMYNNPGEYSFIHTDRDIYIPGDELWYKIYLLNNNAEDSVALSKVCYLLLCNDKGEILQKQTIKVGAKSGHGMLSLPKSLPNGQYFLAGTTMWMQNAENNFLLKKIYITQAFDKKKAASNKNDVSIGFFPESGSFIADTEQKIGVRTIDQDGKSIAASVIVKNSKQEVVSAFNTDQFGMASFTLKTSVGQSYIAEVTDMARGIKKTTALPALQNFGFALSVNNQNSKKLFVGLSLNGTDEILKENYYLIGVMNGQIAVSETFKPSEDLNFIPFNKDPLPKGILQLILINQKGIALAERLVWIDKKDTVPEISVAVKGIAAKRTNSEIKINFPTGYNADLSVSIARLSMFDSTQLDIAAFALLMPLLNAQLDHHPYQLQKILINTSDADNLMLTNGWRKLNNVDIMKENAVKYAFEPGLFLAGTLTKAALKTTIQKGKVDLLLRNNDSTKYIFSEPADINGQFIFRNLPLTKKSTAYYSGTNTANKAAVLDIKFFPHFTDTLKKINVGNIANLLVPKEIQGYVSTFVEPAGLADYKIMEEARVTSKRTNVIDSINKEYVSPLFENADQTIILKDEPGLNIWQLLQRSIAGLSIFQSDGNRTVIFNRYDGVDAFSENGVGTVQFFLNEQPVTNMDIETLIPADVALIKVYKGGLGYVLGAARGGIAIYTVKGRNTDDWRDKGFSKIELSGYEPQYQFYSMDYSKPGLFKVDVDYRPTLYWNPALKIDKSGNTTFLFATDDNTGPWLLQLQGIDQDGVPALIRKQIY